MITLTNYTVDQGYILSVASLRRVLDQASTGDVRFRLEEPLLFRPDADNKPVFWVTLVHNRPTPKQMTDEVTFRIPVLPNSLVLGHEESALVCIHPETFWPQQEGLYLERGRLVGDFIEDFDTVWFPLKTAIIAEMERTQ